MVDHAQEVRIASLPSLTVAPFAEVTLPQSVTQSSAQSTAQPSARSTAQSLPIQEILSSDATHYFHLHQGSIAVQHRHPHELSAVIRGQSGVINSAGSLDLSAYQYRDRVRTGLQEVNWRGTGGGLLPLAAQQLWDIPGGGTPRVIPPPLQAMLPASLPDHGVLSDNILSQVTDAVGASSVQPAHPLKVPFMAPPAYDLRWQVRRRTGTDVLTVQIPHMSGTPLWCMIDGWSQTRHGFSLMGGDADRSNHTAVWRGPVLPVNELVTIDIQVRPELVAIYIDQQLLTWLDTREEIESGISGETPSSAVVAFSYGYRQS